MRKWINIILGSIIAFLGYGCHAKKTIVVDPPVVIDDDNRREVRVMYGPPEYFKKDRKYDIDTTSQKTKIPEEPILMPKYGLPPIEIDQ